MIKLKAQIYKITTKLNEVPIAHRLFIAFMLCSAIYGLSILTAVVLNFNTLEQVKKQETKYVNQAKQFESDLTKLKALVNQPEKASLEEKINITESKIKEVDSQIELITRLLIDPKTMTLLLDSIVSKQDHLTLVSLKSVDHIKQEALGLYQHQLEITVEGSFLDVAKYLHDLEGMPYKVYWKSIDYQTINGANTSPNAVVVLTIYTLSRQGGWLGV
ncbi:hypothetical protein [Marinicellulosiphila megalodicopiae]|uniref:hypothetical protein n=1 Tax=Marinicellulosiphila megalodicopiae TaxID=2724896 RepID=UPI003BB0BDD5